MITIRTLLLLSSIDLLHLHVPAQCDDLFVSEIVEGTGGLMAMEIYNPSNATIGPWTTTTCGASPMVPG